MTHRFKWFSAKIVDFNKGKVKWAKQATSKNCVYAYLCTLMVWYEKKTLFYQELSCSELGQFREHLESIGDALEPDLRRELMDMLRTALNRNLRELREVKNLLLTVANGMQFTNMSVLTMHTEGCLNRAESEEDYITGLSERLSRTSLSKSYDFTKIARLEESPRNPRFAKRGRRRPNFPQLSSRKICWSGTACTRKHCRFTHVVSDESTSTKPAPPTAPPTS